MSTALSELVVLDLCRSYPPAISSAILADFGARVIRVDPMGRAGDHSKMTNDAWRAHMTWDRNKESISVNLRSQKGIEVIHRLIERADILIENSRPGTMESLGIDYEHAKTINPGIIYCAASGFGQNGPYRERPGHDLTYIALSGVLSLITDKDGCPVKPMNFIADIAAAGLYPVIGILIALHARGDSGMGQYIDFSYFDGTVSMLSREVARLFASQCPGGKSVYPRPNPLSGIFETSDGRYVTFSIVEEKYWKKMWKLLGRDQYLEKKYTDDQQCIEEMTECFRHIVRGKTLNEWEEFILTHDVPGAPVASLSDMTKDPQVRHRAMLVEMDHPRCGTVTHTGIPLKLSQTPGLIRGIAPSPGENTKEILGSFGYSETEIERLVIEGDIGVVS